MNNSIGIIGTGNLGSSLIGGLSTAHPDSVIHAASRNTSSLSMLAGQYNLKPHTSISDLCAEVDVIIICVKPIDIRSVLQSLGTEPKLIISTAAAVDVADIQSYLPGPWPIIRAMTNIAVLVGCGYTALYSNTHATPENKSRAESIMRSIGDIQWIEKETDFSAITAIAGSGPAFLYTYMLAQKAFAQTAGLDEHLADLMIRQTVYGSAKLALGADSPLSELMAKVVVKGGVTEAGLSLLTQPSFKAAIQQALSASMQQAEPRKKELPK